MSTRYVAFGLELHSSFALPGMSPDEAWGLPALELARCSAGELEHAWSGSARPPVWRGRLGDGEPLIVRRGIAGDVLYTYAHGDRFHLSADARLLRCAPRRGGL